MKWPSDQKIIRFVVTPKCTTKKQYQMWKSSLTGWSKAVFCRDCTPGYQAQMKEEGRCKYPDVRFVWRTPVNENEGYEESIGTMCPKDSDRVVSEPEPPAFREVKHDRD